MNEVVCGVCGDTFTVDDEFILMLNQIRLTDPACTPSCPDCTPTCAECGPNEGVLYKPTPEVH